MLFKGSPAFYWLSIGFLLAFCWLSVFFSIEIHSRLRVDNVSHLNYTLVS